MMKILFDANISFKVATRVRKIFDVSLHVSNADLSIPAKDNEIWNYAKEKNFVVVTYDEDFSNFVNIYGAPPKVIWLRFGNASVDAICNKIEVYLPDIQDFIQDKNTDILEIY